MKEALVVERDNFSVEDGALRFHELRQAAKLDKTAR